MAKTNKPNRHRKNWRITIWELIIFYLGVVIAFPLEVLARHCETLFNFWISGHNAELSQYFHDSRIGMYISLAALFIVAVLIAILIIFRPNEDSDAKLLKIAKSRYTKGEITQDQYEQIKKAILNDNTKETPSQDS